MSKETFKTFVKKKPELAQLVAGGSMTWQKLYETYDLYGEDESVWNNIGKQNVTPATKTSSFTSFSALTELLKNIDLETVQKGVSGLQKAIGLLQEITNKKEETPPPYEERPIYKYYED